MFHGNGILFKAIEQLPDKDKKNFKEFVSNNNFFNQGNMFITKSSTIMEAYFTDVFSWLLKCEKIFGFKNNHG